MKSDQTDFMIDKFSIVDRECDEGIIAVREKASVQVDKQKKVVKMHDYSYTFDEIIAVAERLKTLNTLTFS
tara:strand:+ start:96 stop:308 length:213 start_codon:yes stop_codon:yes gene_type:complete